MGDMGFRDKGVRLVRRVKDQRDHLCFVWGCGRGRGGDVEDTASSPLKQKRYFSRAGDGSGNIKDIMAQR